MLGTIVIIILVLAVLKLIISVRSQNKKISDASNEFYKILNTPGKFDKKMFIYLVNKNRDIMNLVCSNYKSVNKRSLLLDASKLLPQEEYHSLLKEFESCI